MSTDTAVIFSIIGRDFTGKALGSAGSAFNKLALGMAGASAFLADKLLQSAGNFEQGLTRLVTGAGEQASALGAVGDGVLKLQGQVGESSRDLLPALYLIESGGQHGADGLQVLQAAAEGAKAEQADLATVSDAVTSVLQDYHLKASDAALVTSQLVSAVGAGKTTFELFAGSLSAVLPIASAAHISLADISGDIASMTVHGMSAEQATQNLADVIRHLMAPTGGMTKELAQMGINSQDLSTMLGTKGLSGTLQYLSQTIMQHMGPSGRVMLDTFNKSQSAARDANAMIAAMPAAAANLARAYQNGTISAKDFRKQLMAQDSTSANLLRQYKAVQDGASGFNDLLKSGSPAAQSYIAALRAVTGDATGLNVALMLTGENTDYTNQAIAKVAGTTTEAGNHVKGWAEVQQTFNQKLSEAKGSIEAVGTSIGITFLPKAKALIDKVKEGADWLGRHKEVANDLASAIGLLTVGFITFRIAVTLASLASKFWVVITKGAGVVMGLWNAAMLIAKGRIMEVTAVQWLWNVAMDANPIGLIVIAVAALSAGIFLLWKNSAGFRNFFIGVWNHIWSFLKGVGHWFAHDFVGFFVGAKDKIVHAWDSFVGGVKKKWNDTIDWIKETPHRIAAWASHMWDNIVQAFVAAKNWIVKHWHDLLAKLGLEDPTPDSIQAPGVSQHVYNNPFGGLNAGGVQFPGGSVVVGGGNTGTAGSGGVPHMASGGRVRRGGLAYVADRHGSHGELVSLPGGAQVTPLDRAGALGGGWVLEVRGAEDDFVRMIRKWVRTLGGGSVQKAFGYGKG